MVQVCRVGDLQAGGPLPRPSPPASGHRSGQSWPADPGPAQSAGPDAGSPVPAAARPPPTAPPAPDGRGWSARRGCARPAPPRSSARAARCRAPVLGTRSAVPAGRAWAPAMVFRDVSSDGSPGHSSVPCLSCEPCAPVSVRDGVNGRSDPSGTGSLTQRPPRSASRPSGGTAVPVPPDQPHQPTGSARLRETSARRAGRWPLIRPHLPVCGAPSRVAGETRVAFPDPAQRGNPFPQTGKIFSSGGRRGSFFSSLLKLSDHALFPAAHVRKIQLAPGPTLPVTRADLLAAGLAEPVRGCRRAAPDAPGQLASR